jgi:hypothetical protein
VETAFFWRWWNEQDQQMKDLVHELVNAGEVQGCQIFFAVQTYQIGKKYPQLAQAMANSHKLYQMGV